MTCTAPPNSPDLVGMSTNPSMTRQVVAPASPNNSSILRSLSGSTMVSDMSEGEWLEPAAPPTTPTIPTVRNTSRTYMQRHATDTAPITTIPPAWAAKPTGRDLPPLFDGGEITTAYPQIRPSRIRHFCSRFIHKACGIKSSLHDKLPDYIEPPPYDSPPGYYYSASLDTATFNARIALRERRLRNGNPYRGERNELDGIVNELSICVHLVHVLIIEREKRDPYQWPGGETGFAQLRNEDKKQTDTIDCVRRCLDGLTKRLWCIQCKIDHGRAQNGLVLTTRGPQGDPEKLPRYLRTSMSACYACKIQLVECELAIREGRPVKVEMYSRSFGQILEGRMPGADGVVNARWMTPDYAGLAFERSVDERRSPPFII